eukprot:SAG11_NODE_11520_length_755_cov_1.375000_1_plen_120_part_00
MSVEFSVALWPVGLLLVVTLPAHELLTAYVRERGGLSSQMGICGRVRNARGKVTTGSQTLCANLGPTTNFSTANSRYKITGSRIHGNLSPHPSAYIQSRADPYIFICQHVSTIWYLRPY